MTKADARMEPVELGVAPSCAGAPAVNGDGVLLFLFTLSIVIFVAVAAVGIYAAILVACGFFAVGAVVTGLGKMLRRKCCKGGVA